MFYETPADEYLMIQRSLCSGIVAATMLAWP